MKYVKLIVLATIFALSYSQTKAQQYFGTFIDFKLYSSQLVVNTNSETTTFKFIAGCSRVLDKVVDGKTLWKPFKMNVKLGIESGEVFNTVYTISDADFSLGIGSVFKDFTATIANNKLPNAKYLVIYYNDPSFGFTSYSQYYSVKHYISNNTTTPPVIVPPVVKPIANNIISIEESTNGLYYPKIIGSTPTGGPSTAYKYEWQYKDDSGNFVSIGSPAYEKDFSPRYGETFRRVVKSIDVISYSNELTIIRAPKDNFSITKTAVYDANGLLIGDKIKILSRNSNPNTKYSVLIFGPDDPYEVSVDSNYEFILPLYYNEKYNSEYSDPKNYFASIFSSGGSNAKIYPTWRSGVDLFY